MRRREARNLLALASAWALLWACVGMAHALAPSGHDRDWGYMHHPWLRYSSRWDRPTRWAFDDGCHLDSYPGMDDYPKTVLSGDGTTFGGRSHATKAGYMTAETSPPFTGKLLIIGDDDFSTVFDVYGPTSESWSWRDCVYINRPTSGSGSPIVCTESCGPE